MIISKLSYFNKMFIKENLVYKKLDLFRWIRGLSDFSILLDESGSKELYN